MTWKEKSVSYDENREEVFKSVLGDVKVFWDGLERKEIKKDEEWSKILEVFDEENIMKGFLNWEDVDKIEIFSENLHFPHVDFLLSEDKKFSKKRKIVFFKNNSSESHDNIRRFYNSVKKHKSSYDEKRKLRSFDYKYKDDEDLEKHCENKDDEDLENEKNDISVQDTDLKGLSD